VDDENTDARPQDGEEMTRQKTHKTFISAPTADDLKATPEERQLLNELREWQEKSAQSHWVLGEPTFQ
jgi:hypothetical protein